MSISSVISEHWWALLAVVGGVASLAIDVFLFAIVWKLYVWLNRRTEPLGTFEERLLALEQAEAANARLLAALTQTLQTAKDRRG